LSFFDEDDEPRTRVRPPRRSGPGRGGSSASPDRQTVLIRQLVLFGGFLLVVVLLIFVVRGCRQSAKESSLKDYNRDVASIVRDSDTQVGKPFFDLLRDPSTGDLATQVNGYRVQADQQYQQAKKISTPSEMTAAQRSFLIAMEMRRDGLQQVADQIRTALSSDAEQADQAIQRIAGAMSLFLTSDVMYSERVYPMIEQELRDADVGAQRLQRTQFLPGWQWLDPNTVADALGQQLSADAADGSGREPAPGLHGTGIDSVQVGDQTLDPDAPNRIAYGADTEFTVNFTNQGENDEVDIDVVLRIDGGPKPIRVTKNVASVAAGETATATLSLDSPPPFNTPVDVTVEVKAVPGEEKKDNNKSEYQALFSQQ
jgi:CARDB